MKLSISYNQIEYQQNHIVFKLSELILNNPNLLKVLANIYILIEELKKKKNVDKVKETEKIIKRSIKKSIYSGMIDEDLAKIFIKYWKEISSENLGRVLEQIVANMGPYNIEQFNDFHRSMEVKIPKTEMNNDFDVVFFEKEPIHNYKKGSKIEISGYSEFHECKKNVCTYIPNDPNVDLDKKVYNKLKFMKATYDLKKNGKFYIPTLFPIVNSQREFLQKYSNGEYKFIEVLDIYQIEQKISMCI